MFGGLFGSARRFRALELSETGLVRPDNQDHLFSDAALGVFAVADGMGGGAGGATASATVCRKLFETLDGSAADRARRVRGVQRAIADANASILAFAKAKGYATMGTTATVLVFDPAAEDAATVCHVGDSRAYRVRGGAAVRLTGDHTVGAAMAATAKGLRRYALDDRRHPLAHMLTRAVGVAPTVAVDTIAVDVRGGDRFLVCSDGVHDLVSDAEIAALVATGPLEAARDALAAAVVRGGAHDNYSFVLVEVRGA